MQFNPPNTLLWTEAYNGPYNVVYGHITHSFENPRIDFIERNKVECVGIDTGCVTGGRLTAYILEDKSFVQVAAEKSIVRFGKSNYSLGSPAIIFFKISRPGPIIISEPIIVLTLYQPYFLISSPSLTSFGEFISGRAEDNPPRAVPKVIANAASPTCVSIKPLTNLLGVSPHCLNVNQKRFTNCF